MLVRRQALRFAPLRQRSQEEKYSHCAVPVILDGLDIYLASAHGSDRCKPDERRSTTASRARFVSRAVGVEEAEVGGDGRWHNGASYGMDWVSTGGGSAERSVVKRSVTVGCHEGYISTPESRSYQSRSEWVDVQCSIIIMDGLGRDSRQPHAFHLAFLPSRKSAMLDESRRVFHVLQK